MTEAEGAEQLRLANEVGGMIKRALRRPRAHPRRASSRRATIATKTGTASPVAAAAKTLTSTLEAVEGDMTQMQGEGGQDALNFPGRLDNQLIVALRRRSSVPSAGSARRCSSATRI